jgi:hypothetical protein
VNLAVETTATAPKPAAADPVEAPVAVVVEPVEVHGNGAGLGQERLDVIVVDPS